MTTKKPVKDAKKPKKPRKKKTPNVVEMPEPTTTEDMREYLDAAIGLSNIISPDKITGYFIYVWSEMDDGNFADCAAFNRGGMHPYLFPLVVKKALERNM